MNSSKNTLIGIIAPILWASSLPFIKKCSVDLGPYYLAAFQPLASGIFGLLYFTATKKTNPFAVRRCPRFYHRLILFFSYSALLYPAIYLVNVTNFPVVLLLNYLWPTFTLLFTLKIFRVKFNSAQLTIGTVCIVAGMTMEIMLSNVLKTTSSLLSLEFLPYALAFCAAIVWGLYSSFNRKWGDAAGGTAAIPLLMIFSGGFLLLLAYLSGTKPVLSINIILPLTYLCVTPFISNICWDIGTRQGNLPLLSLCCDFIPWVSLSITAIYLNISLGISTRISASLIILGAATSRFALRQKGA